MKIFFYDILLPYASIFALILLAAIADSIRKISKDIREIKNKHT